MSLNCALVSTQPLVTLLKPNPAWKSVPWRRGANIREVPRFEELAHAVASSLTFATPIERVIIEGPFEGTMVLSFITSLPNDFTADVLTVASPERAFLSRVEDVRRVLYTISPVAYAKGQTPTDRVRVVVADDDRKTREFIAGVVEAVGCDVAEVRTGLEAVKAATEKRPQILLIDGLLPEMSGFEVSRVVRSLDKQYHPRIIMITAIYKEQRYRSDARLKYGVDQYLVKPVTRDQIANAIFGEIIG